MVSDTIDGNFRYYERFWWGVETLYITSLQTVFFLKKTHKTTNYLLTKHGKLIMSLTKKFLKKEPVCKVTFRLPAEVAEEVAILGDFNEWNPETAVTMKKLKKDGSFKAELKFDLEQEVQFRYLLDGETWTNEEEADKFVANDYGTENSVLVF